MNVFGRNPGLSWTHSGLVLQDKAAAWSRAGLQAPGARTQVQEDAALQLPSSLTPSELHFYSLLSEGS